MKATYSQKQCIGAVDVEESVSLSGKFSCREALDFVTASKTLLGSSKGVNTIAQADSEMTEDYHIDKYGEVIFRK